jgi:hypothetical protein
MTLDVYAGLFADDLDDGADRLNALEPRCAPRAGVTLLYSAAVRTAEEAPPERGRSL